MANEEWNISLVTDPDITFLFKDPKIVELNKIIAEIKECMYANLNRFRYDKVPKDKLNSCIYMAILDYVRSCIHVDHEGQLYIGFDAKVILEKEDWNAEALLDTIPRDQILK